MTEQKPEIGEVEEEEALSPKEIFAFVQRAVKENIGLALATGAAVAALGVTIVSALPQTYDSTCKIFVQDNGMVTASLASGREHYRPFEGARGLEEFILAHDNLTSIVREAKLVERWPSTRPWPMRLKDQAAEYLLGPADPSWMERGFVEMLTLSITAAKDGESVRIHGQWRDPESAYEITRLVERNFLSARAAHDLGPIQRAIPFLEQQLQETDQEIESAVSRVQKIKGLTKPEQDEAKPTAASPSAPSPHMASLSTRLSEVRRQQRALTEPRRQKMAELKLALIDMRAQYSDDHPLIRQQEARIASMSEPPPELAELRDEEARILGQLSGGRAVPAATKEGGAAAKAPVFVGDDPELASAQARLGSALRKSDETMAKLEAARIELATAEADFKHRYSVIEEPEIPTAPFKPKKKAMLLGAVAFATILLAVLAAAAREFRKGRLVEAWQVRQLGLDLLGEVELE